MDRKLWARLGLVLLLVVSLACTATPPPLSPSPGPTAPPPPTPTATLSDSGWRALSEGIETRSLTAYAGSGVERLTIARVDPQVVRFRVLYTPGSASPVSGWSTQTGASLVVNAGYFTEENRVTGLTVSNGEVYGAAYGDYAGLFSVTHEGSAGVRWLREQPYVPGESLREAVMCFPVLVKPGGVMGFPADADDGRTSRRTVVAQDSAGRILFLVAEYGRFDLHHLAVWLAESDLEIDIAVNLDGGTSSGFWTPGGPQIDSITPVPAVIAVTSP